MHRLTAITALACKCSQQIVNVLRVFHFSVLFFSADVTRSILSDSPELRKSLQQLQLRDCSDEMKRQLENVLQVTQPMPDS